MQETTTREPEAADPDRGDARAQRSFPGEVEETAGAEGAASVDDDVLSIGAARDVASVDDVWGDDGVEPADEGAGGAKVEPADEGVGGAKVEPADEGVGGAKVVSDNEGVANADEPKDRVSVDDDPTPRGDLDASGDGLLSAPIVELEGVTHSYGAFHALGPLDVRLEGSCVALLGPNGAGKTTLTRIIMGFLAPTAGTVRVLGETVDAQTLRRIGYVPEGDVRFPHLNGLDAVVYAGRLAGMREVDAFQRAHLMLDYVGLQEERYRKVETFSTGMRQRLKIAQALVHDPELLILDEPTEGVDPPARAAIMALIDDLRREHGVRMLVSTHLLADVERIASHAMIINNGRLVLHGALDDLRKSGATGTALRVAGRPEAVMEALAANGLTCRRAHPAIHVDSDDVPQILKIVHAAGAQVRDLGPVQLSLAEVFARAVRDEDDQADDVEAHPANADAREEE